MNEQRLARALGWFSVGLGLAEVVAPRKMEKLLKVGEHAGFLRMCGMRELATGAGILVQQQKRAAWLWARVGGDVLDLVSLGMAVKGDREKKRRVAVALAAVAGVTALDILCSRQLTEKEAL